MSREQTDERALETIEKRGGQLRMAEALKEGIARRTLYRLADEGKLERITRGVYRLAYLPDISYPDLVTVSVRAPKAVICLVSALSFHDLTTQVPHSVWIAIPRDSRPPRIDYPPISWIEVSGKAYESGVERHFLDGTEVRIYGPEKTLADCFKYRNKIGMDVVLEALNLYMRGSRQDIDSLLHFAEICRVSAVMKPYLEALV